MPSPSVSGLCGSVKYLWISSKSLRPSPSESRSGDWNRRGQASRSASGMGSLLPLRRRWVLGTSRKPKGDGAVELDGARVGEDLGRVHGPNAASGHHDDPAGGPLDEPAQAMAALMGVLRPPPSQG